MKEGNASFVDFKRVKEEVSIVQILDHYGVTEALAKGGNGDRLSGACPLHGGTNRTHFRVSVSKNCWNCFGGCPGGGNILDFVSRKEKVSIREAALLIQEWFGLMTEAPSKEVCVQPATPKKERVQEVAAETADTNENKPLTFELKFLDPEHEYLRARGLSDETIRTFGVGYCAKGMLKDRIAIPIHNAEGQLIAYVGRWPGAPSKETPKYKLPAGFRKSLELFNLYRAISAPQDTPLVIVEGFFDCMTLWQHGIRRVVALMGSTLSSEQEILISRMCDSQSRIVIMLNEDDAGRNGREDIARRLTTSLFVRIYRFEQEGQQPENLTLESIAALQYLLR